MTNKKRLNFIIKNDINRFKKLNDFGVKVKKH